MLKLPTGNLSIAFKSALLLTLASQLVGFGGNNPNTGSQFRASGMRGGLNGAIRAGSCGSLPQSVNNAMNETLNFIRSCSYVSGFNKSIAINDYSGATNPPRMYVFDNSGRCQLSVPIAYGGGGRRIAPPSPCSGGGQKLTPAGIHYTAPHRGDRYQEHNSIGLVGLNGQQSKGRGVVIHEKGSAGAPSTWGCPGVPVGTMGRLKSLLGYGSIVNNYFGSKDEPSWCSNKSGAPPAARSCRPDHGAPSFHGREYGSEGLSGPRSRNQSPARR